MKRVLGLALFLGWSVSAFAASTINTLPPIAPFPLMDPGNPLGATENLWISNGNGPGADFRITPLQLGYIFQGPVAPTSPFRYEYWWDTGVSPPQLEIYDGAQWVVAGALNLTAHSWQISPANLAPGSYTNITGVGTLTAGVWNASIIQPPYGGTGINNGAFTTTLGGSVLTAGTFTTAGAFPLTLTTTATTNSTLPSGNHSLAPLDSPAFTTPNIGVATGTSLALGGAAIGANAFAVTGNTALTGTLDVSGTLNVGGASTFGGNVSITGLLSAVTGATALSSLHVVNNTSLDGNLGVAGLITAVNLNASGAVTVGGNATVTGAFGVTGATTLGSTLGVNGAATIGGALGVTGAFGVTGVTTLGNSLTTTAGLTQFGSTAPVHVASAQTTPPALTACGTAPSGTGSTDTAGTVSMGTGTPTGCVITFTTPYISVPHCSVTWRATPLASQSYTVSNVAITLTQTATDSNIVDYTCTAKAGG